MCDVDSRTYLCDWHVFTSLCKVLLPRLLYIFEKEGMMA